MSTRVQYCLSDDTFITSAAILYSCIQILLPGSGTVCTESNNPSQPHAHGHLCECHWTVQVILAMATVQAMKPCAESEIKFADGQKAPPAGQQAIAVDATLASRQAQICSADMAAVRGRLTPEQSKRCSDQTINQFLRATVSNIDQVGLQLCSWTVCCWQEGPAARCIWQID